MKRRDLTNGMVREIGKSKYGIDCKQYTKFRLINFPHHKFCIIQISSN